MEMRLSVNTAVHSRRFVLSVINHFFPPVYFFRRINAVRPVRIKISMPACICPGSHIPILGRGQRRQRHRFIPYLLQLRFCLRKTGQRRIAVNDYRRISLSRSWPPDEPPEPVDGGATAVKRCRFPRLIPPQKMWAELPSRIYPSLPLTALLLTASPLTAPLFQAVVPLPVSGDRHLIFNDHFSAFVHHHGQSQKWHRLHYPVRPGCTGLAYKGTGPVRDRLSLPSHFYRSLRRQFAFILFSETKAADFTAFFCMADWLESFRPVNVQSGSRKVSCQDKYSVLRHFQPPDRQTTQHLLFPSHLRDALYCKRGLLHSAGTATAVCTSQMPPRVLQ